MTADEEWADEGDMTLLQSRMQVLNTLVVDLEMLPRVIRSVEHADSVGWIADSTLWRDTADARQQSLRLMRALEAYRQVVVEIAAETGQELPAGLGRTS